MRAHPSPALTNEYELPIRSQMSRAENLNGPISELLIRTGELNYYALLTGPPVFDCKAAAGVSGPCVTIPFAEDRAAAPDPGNGFRSCDMRQGLDRRGNSSDRVEGAERGCCSAAVRSCA